MREKTHTYQSEAYGPATFHNTELDEVEVTLGVGPKKYIIKGPLSINAVETAKYGPQIQLQVFSAEYERRDRVSNAWNRLEIFLGPWQITELVENLIEAQLYFRFKNVQKDEKQ